jgi:hypothetical protein
MFDDDKCGFTVTGIPHIFDSVVLTGLSFDDGLLGLHLFVLVLVMRRFLELS